MTKKLCHTCRKEIHPPHLFEVGQLCIGREITFEIVGFDKFNPTELKLKCVALNKRWRDYNTNYEDGFQINSDYIFKYNGDGVWISPVFKPWHLVDGCSFVHQF